MLLVALVQLLVTLVLQLLVQRIQGPLVPVLWCAAVVCVDVRVTMYIRLQ